MNKNNQIYEVSSSKMSDPQQVLKNALTRELVREQRSGFIAELLAHPVYSLASMITEKHFEAVARRHAVSTRALPWHALLVRVIVPQRIAVVCRGGLSALLVQMLICFGSVHNVKSALKHATCVMSRRHSVGLNERIPKCVSTLQGHSEYVYSVAFHPSAPYLATGSHDSTAKLWLLNGNDAACVSTLQGHSDQVTSVAFHPSAPYLATGSIDKTAKLWR